MLPDLVYYLVGFGISVDSMMIGQGFPSQVEEASGGPADRWEIVLTFVGATDPTIVILSFDDNFKS